MESLLKYKKAYPNVYQIEKKYNICDTIKEFNLNNILINFLE
jgi:hypothetical protein